MRARLLKKGDCLQRPKKTGSRVALLPREFLCVGICVSFIANFITLMLIFSFFSGFPSPDSAFVTYTRANLLQFGQSKHSSPPRWLLSRQRPSRRRQMHCSSKPYHVVPCRTMISCTKRSPYICTCFIISSCCASANICFRSNP